MLESLMRRKGVQQQAKSLQNPTFVPFWSEERNVPGAGLLVIQLDKHDKLALAR